MTECNLLFGNTQTCSLVHVHVPLHVQTTRCVKSVCASAGAMDLVYTSQMQRLQGLQILLKASEGTHLQVKGVKLIKMKAFMLEPLSSGNQIQLAWVLLPALLKHQLHVCVRFILHLLFEEIASYIGTVKFCIKWRPSE